MDNTFTLLDRGSVYSFLQYLNNQEPSIRFTMNTKIDRKLAFVDTALSREADGRLTTNVYRKPTQTDQYLAYDSHHPQSVKRGIVKCLYDRAKRNVTKPSVISKEKKLSSFFLAENYQDQKTEHQHRAHDRIQNHRGFTLRRRFVRATTRRTHCFQVGNYAKITPSTAKRPCRPD